MMSEADQIEYAIKMSLQQHDTASDAETPNIDSSREATPMNTDITSMVRLDLIKHETLNHTVYTFAHYSLVLMSEDTKAITT